MSNVPVQERQDEYSFDLKMNLFNCTKFNYIREEVGLVQMDLNSICDTVSSWYSAAVTGSSARLN